MCDTSEKNILNVAIPLHFVFHVSSGMRGSGKVNETLTTICDKIHEQRIKIKNSRNSLSYLFLKIKVKKIFFLSLRLSPSLSAHKTSQNFSYDLRSELRMHFWIQDFVSTTSVIRWCLCYCKRNFTWFQTEILSQHRPTHKYSHRNLPFSANNTTRSVVQFHSLLGRIIIGNKSWARKTEKTVSVVEVFKNICAIFLNFSSLVLV